MQFLVIEDGETVLEKPSNLHFWRGFFSDMPTECHLINFIKKVLKNMHDLRGTYSSINGKMIKNDILFVLPTSDGNLKKSDIEKYVEMAEQKCKILVVGTLAQREIDPNIRFVYLPLDDSIFYEGIMKEEFIPSCFRIPLETRIPQLIWRGACTGESSSDGMDSIRAKTVTKLMGNPDADVKFILRFYEDKQIPAEYFSNMFNHVDFLKYKYFLIVDGAVIASNHMWGFATGCVPFIVSNAVCWFSPFLKPYENYIPVAYDLSDLETQIKWVKENDGEAKRIAENAIEFSKIVFGSEFQHLWLEKQFVEMATE